MSIAPSFFSLLLFSSRSVQEYLPAFMYNTPYPRTLRNSYIRQIRFTWNRANTQMELPTLVGALVIDFPSHRYSVDWTRVCKSKVKIRLNFGPHDAVQAAGKCSGSSRNASRFLGRRSSRIGFLIEITSDTEQLDENIFPTTFIIWKSFGFSEAKMRWTGSCDFLLISAFYMNTVFYENLTSLGLLWNMWLFTHGENTTSLQYKKHV